MLSYKSNDILQIENLQQHFGNMVLFENFNLNIKRNSFTALMGPNGSGKSTLLNIIAGLTPITSGILKLGNSNRKNKEEQVTPTVIFQEPRLLPWKTALDNVTFSLRIAGVQREIRNKKAKDIMEKLEVYDARAKYPNELSGGMQQKLNIARAIITNPEFLLIDEPFNNLDVLTIGEISKFLQIYGKEEETTILMVNHIIELSSSLANNYVFLNGGRNGSSNKKPVVVEHAFDSHDLNQKILDIANGVAL